MIPQNGGQDADQSAIIMLCPNFDYRNFTLCEKVALVPERRTHFRASVARINIHGGAVHKHFNAVVDDDDDDIFARRDVVFLRHVAIMSSRRNDVTTFAYFAIAKSIRRNWVAVGPTIFEVRAAEMHRSHRGCTTMPRITRMVVAAVVVIVVAAVVVVAVVVVNYRSAGGKLSNRCLAGTSKCT